MKARNDYGNISMKLYQTYISVWYFCFQVVKARNGELKNWEEFGCLKSIVAFIILIDQFCRNIYRVRIGIHLWTLHLLENGVNHFFHYNFPEREAQWACVAHTIFSLMQAVVLCLSDLVTGEFDQNFGFCENVISFPGDSRCLQSWRKSFSCCR